MIKKSKPDLSEIDNILENNHPKKNGIWINKESKEKILKVLNKNSKFNSEYFIDAEGYLRSKSNNNQTEYDKKLEKCINGEKIYIIDISSICYIVDNVTGMVLDYSFENMDRYQTFEYFKDSEKMIIFITENKNNQLTEDEIIDSVMLLIE